MTKDTVAPMTKALDAVFLWVMTTGILASVLLFGVGFLAPHPVVQDLARRIGAIVVGAVIVSLIQVKALGDFYSKRTQDALLPNIEALQNALTTELRKLQPELKQETRAAVEQIRDRVTEAASFMQEGIGVLSGAKLAGIVNIFPNRYEKVTGESVIDAIARDLRAESAQIRLMGISLGDYFLDRGVLHTTFSDIVETHRESSTFRIKALVVDPKCDNLKERARWEAGSEYYREPAFFDSTTFIETDGAARIAKRLCEKRHGLLDVRTYCQPPTAFVLLTSRFAFIEGYNYADRGSRVPLLQVAAGSPLYKAYETHFDRIWDVSRPITEYDPFSVHNRGPM